MIWDAPFVKNPLTINPSAGAAGALAWSPDGNQIAAAIGDKTVEVWDATSGRLRTTLHGHKQRVSNLAWSGDGEHLASLDIELGVPATIKVWNTRTWQEAATLTGLAASAGSFEGRPKLAWSPDDRWLAGSSYGTLKVWAQGNWQEVFKTKGDHWENALLGWSRRESGFAFRTQDGLHVWHEGDTDAPLLSPRRNISTLVPMLSPDEQWVASPSGNGILIRDPFTGQDRIRLDGHTDHVRNVSWSPDGRRLVSESQDGTIKVWDVTGGPDGQELFTFRSPPGGAGYHAVAFSPDGKRLAAGLGNSVRIWDAAHDRPTEMDPRLVQRAPMIPGGDPKQHAELNLGIAGAGVLSVFVFVMPAWLLVSALRRYGWDWRLLMVAGLAVTIALVAHLVFLYGNFWKPDVAFPTPFKVPWRDQLLAAVIAIPGATFLWSFIVCILQRRWVRLGLIVAAFVLVPLVLIIQMFWTDPKLMQPLYHYSWEGWSFVFLPAAFFGGGFILMVLILGPPLRFLWRFTRR